MSTEEGVESPRRSAPGVLLEGVSGFLDNLVMRGIARHKEPDIVELFITDEEAREGGMAAIRMRVPFPCASCGGSGIGCARCNRTGIIEKLFSAWLAIRPDVADGTIVHPSALLPDMRPITFRIRRAVTENRHG